MRLNRRKLRLTKGKLSNMSQERQKLSFFFVLIFLGVFGVIVLAEVLFMEDKGHLSGTDFFYDENNWDTPRPLSDGGGSAPASSIRVGDSKGNRNDRFQKSLKHHQEEMERLIRNISARIQSSMAASASPVSVSTTESPPRGSSRGFLTPPPLRPYNYLREDGPLNLTFDFDLSQGNFSGYDARWQPVNGTMSKFYVYSAYYDGRRDLGDRRTVRIIGAAKTKLPERVFCQFHVSKPEIIESGWPRPRPVPAKVSVIRENWNLKYSACFVLCPVPSELASVPTSVSVITLPSKHANPLRRNQETAYTTSNQLPVLNHDVGTGSVAVNNTNELGVCVKPIHFHYNHTLELVEFIELNRLLGVTKFTFYNDTISPSVDCLLRKYMEEGIVEVLSWKLPVKSQSEIRTEGLFAALNDCLYRNMNRFHYLMLIDFDEFIIPRDNKTIPDMLKFIDAQRKAGAITATGAGSGVLARVRMNAGLKVRQRYTSSYSFQNSFFYLQFADDESASSGPGSAFDHGRGLRVLRKTRRKDKFNPQKQRSKYICIPRHVAEAGNHFIWEFVSGYNVNVPTSVGFLHHYRVCEFGGNDCVKTESKVDRTVYRYREDLVHNMEQVLEVSCPEINLGGIAKKEEEVEEKPEEKSDKSDKEQLSQSDST